MSEQLTDKLFPIQRGLRSDAHAVPWRLAEIAYTAYARRYGTDQSLKRLAERGGFGVEEIAELILVAIADLERQLAKAQRRLDAIERVLDDNSGAASGVRHEVRASYMNSPYSTVDIVTCRSDCPRCALDRILHPKEAK